MGFYWHIGSKVRVKLTGHEGVIYAYGGLMDYKVLFDNGGVTGFNQEDLDLVYQPHNFVDGDRVKIVRGMSHPYLGMTGVVKHALLTEIPEWARDRGFDLMVRIDNWGAELAMMSEHVEKVDDA